MQGEVPQALGELRMWSQKLAEVKLGVSFLSGRRARRTLTPLMERILAVAYSELAGQLKAQQQLPGGRFGTCTDMSWVLLLCVTCLNMWNRT